MLIHNVAGRSGSYTRASGLARGLSALGHDVSLMTGSRNAGVIPSIGAWDGITLIESPDIAPERIRHAGFGPVDTASRMAYLAPRGYDLVHAFEHRPSVLLPAGWLWLKSGLPVVSDWADLWGPEGILDERPRLERWTVGVYDRILEQRSHLRAAAATVVSSNLEKRMLEAGYEPNRLLKLGPGVDPEQVRQVDLLQARREFGIPGDVPVVGIMGVSAYDDALAGEAFCALCAVLPEAHLLVVGPPKPKLDEVIGAAGRRDRVYPLGFLPFERLGTALSCADVLLLPFTDRPINQARFPSRFGEYLAIGRPIVTNRTGDLGEVVESQHVGLVVPGQAPAMARAMADVLGNPRQSASMGAAARRLAEGPFSWEHMAEALEGLYRRVLADRD